MNSWFYLFFYFFNLLIIYLFFLYFLIVSVQIDDPEGDEFAGLGEEEEGEGEEEKPATSWSDPDIFNFPFARSFGANEN